MTPLDDDDKRNDGNDVKCILFPKKKPFNNAEKATLLELYKILVDGLNVHVVRRDRANGFFLGMNILILSLVMIPVRIKTDVPKELMLVAPAFGLLISIYWFMKIGDYILRGKYKHKIIECLEKCFPASIITYEECLRKNEKKKKNILKRELNLERGIPIIFCIIHIIAIIFFFFTFVTPLNFRQWC